MSKDKEKKQRVIHTRVSEALDQELRDRAAKLGVSVSNLVRNVLSNTSDLVETIVQDSASLARSARGEREPGARPRAAAAAAGVVIGWQPMVLNLNALCVTCNAILPKGSEAALGITDRGEDRPISCKSCVEKLSDESNDQPAS